MIGAETFSRILDWEDRTTCVLFGDGAGAVVMEAQEGEPSIDESGVLTCQLRSDGRHKEKLYVDGGPSTTGTAGHLRMQGKEVFKHAVGMVTDVIEAAFDATGTSAKIWTGLFRTRRTSALLMRPPRNSESLLKR